MSPEFIQTVAASIVVGTLTGLATSYVTFRLTFERFKAMDEERQKHWEAWRDWITKEVEILKSERGFIDYGVRLRQSEAFIEELREWKHVKVDPYINAMNAMNSRVERLERFQDGKVRHD